MIFCWLHNMLTNHLLSPHNFIHHLLFFNIFLVWFYTQLTSSSLSLYQIPSLMISLSLTRTFLDFSLLSVACSLLPLPSPTHQIQTAECSRCCRVIRDTTNSVQLKVILTSLPWLLDHWNWGFSSNILKSINAPPTYQKTFVYFEPNRQRPTTASMIIFVSKISLRGRRCCIGKIREAKV